LHAVYGDFEITVAIASSKVNGDFPRRAFTHVQEWLTQHRHEILDSLTLARANKPLLRTEPLE
jgi:hypothetical protein